MYVISNTFGLSIYFLNTKRLVPICGAVYTFGGIRDAIAAQDEGKANGKIVVKL